MMQMLRWKSMLAGAVAFVALHLLLVATWETWSAADGVPAWFMNSGRAVAFTAACFLIGNAIAAAAMPVTTSDAIVAACNVTAGALVPMIVVLLDTGQGTLFPIAIAIGVFILGVSSVAGALAGHLLTASVARRRHS